MKRVAQPRSPKRRRGAVARPMHPCGTTPEGCRSVAVGAVHTDASPTDLHPEAPTAALEAAGVPCAVIGGNAVATWVAQRDAGAVRAPRDVDLLMRRADLLRLRLIDARLVRRLPEERRQRLREVRDTMEWESEPPSF